MGVMELSHAKLSASGSHRWLHCTPSVLFESNFPQSVSKYADEGTAAHELSEWKLYNLLNFPYFCVEKPLSSYYSKDMDIFTDMYVDFINRKKHELLDSVQDMKIELKVDFSEYAPEGFGTADCVMICDRELHIFDLKYGKGVWVNAKNNTQLMLYALGALLSLDSPDKIKRISMSICQPRLNNFDTSWITRESLIFWAENELKPKADMAFNGEGEFIPGDHCKFCRGKSKCKVRSDENAEFMEKIRNRKKSDINFEW